MDVVYQRLVVKHVKLVQCQQHPSHHKGVNNEWLTSSQSWVNTSLVYQPQVNQLLTNSWTSYDRLVFLKTPMQSNIKHIFDVYFCIVYQNDCLKNSPKKKLGSQTWMVSWKVNSILLLCNEYSVVVLAKSNPSNVNIILCFAPDCVIMIALPENLPQ